MRNFPFRYEFVCSLSAKRTFNSFKSCATDKNNCELSVFFAGLSLRSTPAIKPELIKVGVVTCASGPCFGICAAFIYSLFFSEEVIACCGCRTTTALSLLLHVLDLPHSLSPDKPPGAVKLSCRSTSAGWLSISTNCAVNILVSLHQLSKFTFN